MNLKELKRELFEIRTEIALKLDDKKELIEKEKLILKEIKKQISEDINNKEGNKVK